MGSISGLCLALGIGVAIGMLAGTTGTHGSARGRMTLLAAVIAVGVGLLLADTADVEPLAGALLALGGAVVACIVVSDVVAGAGRREGGGTAALGFFVSLGALLVVAIALLLAPLNLLVLAGLIWLGASRHRRAQRKHAGLRVLR